LTVKEEFIRGIPLSCQFPIEILYGRVAIEKRDFRKELPSILLKMDLDSGQVMTVEDTAFFRIRRRRMRGVYLFV